MDPTDIYAVNIGGTTIHSGLDIKPGVKLLGLSDIIKISLTRNLLEVKILLIDKFKMVSSGLFFIIYARLLKIYMCCIAIEFLGVTVGFVADLLRVSPVMSKPVHATVDGCDTLERHLALKIWCMFQFAELTEVMRERSDTKFRTLEHIMELFPFYGTFFLPCLNIRVCYRTSYEPHTRFELTI